MACFQSENHRNKINIKVFINKIHFLQYGGIPPNIVAWFQAVDADRSGQISGVELQQALTNQDWSRFSLPTCYKMIGNFVVYIIYLFLFLLYFCYFYLNKIYLSTDEVFDRNFERINTINA